MRIGQRGAQFVGREVGVVERAAAVGEQFAYEGNARGVGGRGLLQRASELEHLGAHHRDTVAQHRASVEPVWGLVGVRRASQPAGERVAAAGTGQVPPLAGEIRQPRELREYRERRQTALTRDGDPRASVTAQTAHAAIAIS